MHEPENNEVAGLAVTHVVWLYPKVDCLVYDRACSFKPFATTNAALDQIRLYIIDGFHAHGHSRSCTCNPRILHVLLCVFFGGVWVMSHVNFPIVICMFFK